MRPVIGFMATVKNSPLMGLILEEMNNEEVSNKHAFDATGPHMLHNSLKKFFETGGKLFLKVYSLDFFYPAPQLQERIEPSKLAELYPDCFLFHLYHATWTK